MADSFEDSSTQLVSRPVPARVASRIVVRDLQPDDEPSLDAFICAHPRHGPGHRRQFAELEGRLGNRELSAVALIEGKVVGYAPAFLMTSRQFAVLRSRSVVGGSLVAAGPLIDLSLPQKTRAEVLSLLLDSIRSRTSASGATWLRYTLSSISGEVSTITAERPFPLLSLGFTLRTIPSPVLDLAHTESELYEGLGATTRNLLRRGERDGLRARPVQSAKEWQAFAAVADPSLGHKPAAVECFQAIYERLISPSGAEPALAHATVVEHAGEPVSCVVTCESNHTSYYFMALNTPRGLALNANRVALWQAIRDAKHRGSRWFLLGSRDFGATKSARISDFKQQFGGTLMLSPVAEWCQRPVRTAATDLISSIVGHARRRGRSAP